MVAGRSRTVTLHRFFLPPESFVAEDVRFPRDVSRQIRAVLRLRPGDRVIALDGSGTEMVVRLDQVGVQAVGAIEQRRRNEAEPETTLALNQGLLKAAKFELALQKCTEIGVSHFVPVTTARSVSTEPSLARQQRFDVITREAAEQSGRGRVPTVSPPRPFSEALTAASSRGPVVLLWEDEDTVRLRNVPLETDQVVSLFVGPEGGFTGDEVEEAKALGAHVITLGRRTLRAETAAIAGATLLLERLNELS